MKDVAKFDKNGIWFYRKVGFTKYKNSLELIVHLINNSKRGLSREQIQEITKIQTFQQIQTLLKRNELYRSKIGNKYIYLPEELAENREKRQQLLSACLRFGLIISDFCQVCKHKTKFLWNFNMIKL